MIEQVMNSNILHEASTLLKKQNKENNNDKSNVSFNDLLKPNNSDSLRSDEISQTIIITFEDNQDNIQQTFNEVDNNENYLKNENYIKEQNEIYNTSEYKDNIDNKNINNSKIIKNDNKTHKDKLDQNINSSKLVKYNTDFDKIKNSKESLESINIKLRYGHVDLKSDLDFKTKQKIKSIMMDLKSGKIDTNIANAFISQLIRTSHINGLKTIDKKIKVEIKKVQIKNSQDKDIIKDLLKSDLDLVKNKEGLKSNKNLNQFSSADKNKLNLKINNKLKISKEQSKGEEVKSSDFKSEIKLQTMDNKNINVPFNKDVPLNTKEVLQNNKQQLFQQVAKNTKIVLAQNQTKFSTMIRPENLGRIDFQFVVKDGKLNGRLVMQNQEVVDFFKSNIEEMRAVMQKSNVELGNIEIILAGNRFGEFSGNQDNNNFVNEDNNLTYNNNVFSKNIESFEENNLFEKTNYSKKDNSNINILI